MGLSERIRVILDLDGKSFMSQLKTVRAEVAATEGVSGKLKVATKGLGDAFTQAGKNPAVMGAAMAGAGVIAVGLANDFSELGTTIGKFSDATGLSSEEASRWVEVAKSIGIETGTLQSEIGKMNKTLGATPQVFTDAGIAIKGANGEALDTNDVFLNVIDKLNRTADAGKRTELGAKLLGRGWQASAELVGKGADEIRTKLAEVSDAQVFNDDEVAKARAWRDAMDDVGDAVEQVKIMLGELVATNLSPLITVTGTLANKLLDLTGAGGDSSNGLADMGLAAVKWLSPVGYFTQGASALNRALDDNAGITSDVSSEWSKAALDAAILADATSETEREARALNRTVGEAPAIQSETDRETRALTRDTKLAAAAAHDAAAETQKQLDALQELQNEMLSAVDKQFAYADAIDSATDAATDYHKALKDGKSTVEEQDDALRGAEESANDAAKAFAELQQANGNTSSAIDLMKLSLQQQANALGPNDPLRAGIMGLIASLDAIPQSVPDAIKLKVDTQIWNETVARLERIKALLAAIKSGNAYALNDAVHNAGERAGLRTQSVRGIAGTTTTGAGSSASDGPSDLLNSGLAGTWEAATTAIDDTTSAVDDAAQAAADAEAAEIELARRKYMRGEIDIDQYQSIIEEKRQLAETQFGHDSDQEYALWEITQDLNAKRKADEEALAASIARAAQDAADAAADAEKKRQDAIQATIDKLKELQAASLKQADANADLLDAIDAQAKAQSDYNAALAAYNAIAHDPKAKPEDRAAALIKVADAQKDLDSTTIAGAKARAAAAGLSGTDAAENIAAQLRQYIADHGDPTGALGRELIRQSPGGTGFASTTPFGGASIRTEDMAALGNTIATAISRLSLTVSARGVATAMQADAKAGL